MTGALLARPANELLDAFGAGKATPGSGSAAALMGILSAKLIRTVCLKSIEKGKPKASSWFQFIIDQSAESERKLQEAFTNDSKMFEDAIRHRRERDKATDRATASQHMRRANDLLEEGTDGLFEIAEECLKLVDLGVGVFEEGWSHVRGDAGAAICAAMSGAMSCLFIISLNAKTLKDRVYASRCMTRCNELSSRVQAKQSKAFSCAGSISAEALEAIQISMDMKAAE